MQEERKKLQVERILKYFICILLLSSLIGIAFVGPQLVFRVQDDHYIENIQISKRNGMDIEALNASYEKDLKKRLEKFEDGLNKGKVYLTTETVYEKNENFEEILGAMMEQPWAFLMPDISYYIYKTDYELTTWKRYTVYDKEFEEGVIFMMYFVEVLLDGQRIQFLVDTEDLSLYYIRFQRTDVETEGIVVSDYLDVDMLYNCAYSWYDNYISEISEEEYLAASKENGSVIIKKGEVQVDAVSDVEEIKSRMNLFVTEDGTTALLLEENNCRWIWGIYKNSEESALEIYFGLVRIGELIPEIKEKIPSFVQN